MGRQSHKQTIKIKWLRCNNSDKEGEDCGGPIGEI